MNLCKDCVSKNICGNPNVTGCISYTKQDDNFLPINCYVCNASGRIAGNGHRHSHKCTRCNGTGQINYYSLTKFDWLKMATMEELAEWIFEVYMTDKHHLFDRIESAEYEQGNSGKQEIMEWLKEKHNATNV